MWHGVGVIAGLLLIVLDRLAGDPTREHQHRDRRDAVDDHRGALVLLLVFVIIRFLDKPGPSIANEVVSRTIWAWIGLVLAIVIVASGPG